MKKNLSIVASEILLGEFRCYPCDQHAAQSDIIQAALKEVCWCFSCVVALGSALNGGLLRSSGSGSTGWRDCCHYGSTGAGEGRHARNKHS